MQVGMGIGIGCGPMIGGTVADAFGYGAAFYITGALLALAGVIVAFGVEEQFDAGAPVKGHHERLWVKWRQILSTQAIPVVFSLGFLNQMGRMIYVPVLPLFVLSLLDNPSQVNSFSGVMIGLSSAAAALFSVFLGRMGDRIGHRKIFMVSAVGCALFFFLQSRVSDSMQLMMIHIVTGIALGGIVPSISALLAQFTRPGQEGAVYGLDNSINSAGRAIGPMLGAFIAAMLGLRAVFEATALLYLITAVIALVFLSRSTVRPSRTVKGKD
jgi:DHA1 family multidrug resistance protein-like MFS transporter